MGIPVRTPRQRKPIKPPCSAHYFSASANVSPRVFSLLGSTTTFLQSNFLCWIKFRGFLAGNSIQLYLLPVNFSISMLCETCQRIVFQPPGTAPGEPSRSARHNPIACFSQSPSIQSLQKSAEDGCRFCNRLLYAFQNWELAKIQAGPTRPVWITVQEDPQEEGIFLLKVFCGKRSASIYLKDPCEEYASCFFHRNSY